jgi:hypothetical protein
MPVQEAVAALNRWDQLTKERFDVILAPFGVNHDDEGLVSALIDQGWHCTPYDDEFLYQRDLQQSEIAASPV